MEWLFTELFTEWFIMLSSGLFMGRDWFKASRLFDFVYGTIEELGVLC